MANLLIPNWNLHKNKNAIILCNKNKIENYLTYQELYNFYDLIKNFLLKHIKKKNECIGLKMTHNIYIPSIIISLKELEYPFIFLDENNSPKSELINILNINWILSFNSNYGHLIDTIRLKNNDELLLIKTTCKFTKKPTIYNKKNIFYVIQTSGTTGKNKLVYVEDNCILDNISSLRKKFDITSDDIIYFGTSLTFDPSIIELLLALQSRACLLIVPSKQKNNFLFLYQTLFPSGGESNPGITVLQIVPSLFLIWIDKIQNILLNPQLKILAFGGEPFPQQILNYEKSSKLRIFNLYGITEMSCWATCHEIDQNISLGIPLGCTTIEIRDKYGNKIEENGKGEIFIGSKHRICYVDNEEFVEFRSTGDLGQFINKNLYYLGRKNDLIKRLGHKIYLSQIETIIFKQTEFSNKCIWFESESKLLCFLTINNYNNDLNKKILDKIRIKLLHSLEPYQFPDFFEILPRFPITTNGKIDLKSLITIYINQETINLSQNCDTVFEMLLIKYFGCINNNKNLTFSDLGGNSILAIQIISELSHIMNIEYPGDFVSILFENDLNSCINYLKNYQYTKKIKRWSQPFPSKRIKTSKELIIRWKYNLNACVDAPPIVFTNNDRILIAIGSFSHYFIIVDENCKEIAKFTFSNAIESSATISNCGNFIFVGCFNGKMYCLTVNNKIKWSYTTNDRIKCKPTICHNFEWIVFGSYDKHIHCVRIEDGICVWKTNTFHPVITTPLVSTPKIFVATINGTCLCLNEITGEILWKYQSASPIFGSPCFYNNNTTIWPNVHGLIFSLNQNGEKLWEFETSAHIYSSIIVYDNLIIFGCHNFKLYIINVIDNFVVNLVNVINLNSKITSTPFIGNLNGNNVIVVCTNLGMVYILDLYQENNVLYQLDLGNEIFSSPFLFNNKIYVGCRDDNLYCLEV